MYREVHFAIPGPGLKRLFESRPRGRSAVNGRAFWETLTKSFDVQELKN